MRTQRRSHRRPEKAADAAGATFVDLFTPTLKLYETTDEPLTLNGIHLNANGYRKLADVIAEQLVGESATGGDSLSMVYQAVEDKNWHWHNRYRATDGNDIWGSRSTLSFVDGQTNADVLVHELKMLDLMTANRDPVIWAAASGKSIKPDDSNVPAPVVVKTNVGGGAAVPARKRKAARDYLSPEESLKKIKVPDGFRVEHFRFRRNVPRPCQSRAIASRWERATVGGQLEFVSEVATRRRPERQLDDL